MNSATWPSEPVWWRHWLFESPMWTIATLVAVGFLLFVLDQRRKDRRLMWVALACVLGAGLNFMVAKWVVTPREALLSRTNELIAATAPLDIAKVRLMFGEDAVLRGPGGETWLSLSPMLDALDASAGKFGIERNTIAKVQAEARTPTVGLSLFDLKTRFDSGTGFPIATRWLATWSLETNAATGADGTDGTDGTTNGTGKTWVISEIQWLTHDGPNGLNPYEGIWRR